MALDGCGLVCKYILIIFNIIFTLLGFTFLALGLWLRFSASIRGIFDIDFLNSSVFLLTVIVLIVLGSVMLIVVAFGDYGVCNEKRCALQVFSVLLAMLAVAEVAVGVLAYANRDKVQQSVVELYTTMYAMYLNNGDPIIGAALTFINKALYCCGLTGVQLVELAQQTCPEPQQLLHYLAMPSCPKAIGDLFNSKAPLVMLVFGGIGALQILAMICSAILSKQIRQSASSPQYIILTHSTPVLANPQPSQHEFVSTSCPYPDQDPVVFTPLTVANIPVAQA